MKTKLNINWTHPNGLLGSYLVSNLKDAITEQKQMEKDGCYVSFELVESNPVTKIAVSRNKREGKFLTQRGYKIKHYSRKQYKRDRMSFDSNNCNCGKEHPKDFVYTVVTATNIKVIT